MSANEKVRNKMKLSFPSLPENVAFARTTVAMFASQLEFTLDEIDDIKVAISEAVSNCVIHAYPEEPGDVTVTGAIYEGGDLEIGVIDEGIGIEDIEAAFEPAFTTQPEERTGLGLVFIKEYMDSVNLQSAVGEGTRVIMRKRPETKGETDQGES